MKISYRDFATGERRTVEATLSTERAESSYGIPVIVANGDVVDVASWMMLNYQVEEATDEELEGLRKALRIAPATDPWREHLSAAGRRTSERKAAAVRENGRKGGRGHKKPPTE